MVHGLLARHGADQSGARGHPRHILGPFMSVPAHGMCPKTTLQITKTTPGVIHFNGAGKEWIDKFLEAAW